MTASGRLIPQPPWIVAGCEQSAIAYDNWLVEEARKEALELGENLLIARLAALSAGPLDADLRHLLSDFLFGLPDPVFEARDGSEASHDLYGVSPE